MPKKKAPDPLYAERPLHSDDIWMLNQVAKLVAGCAEQIPGAQWDRFAVLLRETAKALR